MNELRGMEFNLLAEKVGLDVDVFQVACEGVGLLVFFLVLEGKTDTTIEDISKMKTSGLTAISEEIIKYGFERGEKCENLGL